MTTDLRGRVVLLGPISRLPLEEQERIQAFAAIPGNEVVSAVVEPSDREPDVKE